MKNQEGPKQWPKRSNVVEKTLHNGKEEEKKVAKLWARKAKPGQLNFSK